MCDRTVLVPIPDFLKDEYQYIFNTNEYGPTREFDIDSEGRQCFALDECIASVVKTLWNSEIRTLGCCCGHGSGHGVVSIEVPNGGDTERQRKQTRYYYRQMEETFGKLHQW